jgi:hypothetical protein
MDLDPAIAELESDLDAIRQQLRPLQQEEKELVSGIAALKAVQRRRRESSRPTADHAEQPEVGHRTTNRDADGTVDPTAPRGSAAVEIILRERPRGQWVSLTELVDEFAKRGWGPNSSNPREAVRANAYRLINSNSKKHEFEGGRSNYRRRPPVHQLQQDSPTMDEGGGGHQEGLTGGQNSALSE